MRPPSRTDMLGLRLGEGLYAGPKALGWVESEALAECEIGFTGFFEFETMGEGIAVDVPPT